MRYIFSFALLTLGTALTTAGLSLWQERAYDMAELWAFTNGPHPVLLLAVGIALIPSALWELFLLETQRHDE